MTLISILVAVAVVASLVVLMWWVRLGRTRRLVAEHTIEPEELHALLDTERAPRLFDVRFPLDVLAYSEGIPAR